MIYYRFFVVIGVRQKQNGSFEGEPICTKFGQNIARSLAHPKFKNGLDISLGF